MIDDWLMVGLTIFFLFFFCFCYMARYSLIQTEYEMRDIFVNESTEISMFVWKAMRFCHWCFLVVRTVYRWQFCAFFVFSIWMRPFFLLLISMFSTAREGFISWLLLSLLLLLPSISCLTPGCIHFRKYLALGMVPRISTGEATPRCRVPGTDLTFFSEMSAAEINSLAEIKR